VAEGVEDVADFLRWLGRHPVALADATVTA
jgi:hypothetical protein